MEVAFEAVGTHGKWQKILSITIILITPMCLFIGIAFPLLTKEPEFFLCEKEIISKNNNNNNFKDTDYQENSQNSKKKTLELCSLKKICEDIKSSKKFHFEPSIEQNLNNWSLSFKLYCSKGYITKLYGTTFFIGGMLGAIILSPLPDKYGRKNIYKYLTLFILIFHLIILFSPNEWILLITIFLLGLTSFAYSMSSSIITEYMDRNYSGMIMTLNNVNFPVTGILCAIFFLYVNNWRLLFFITSSLSMVNYYFIDKYFLESPVWLNSKNKFIETLDTFKKISEINGTEENFMRFKDLNSSKSFIFF